MLFTKLTNMNQTSNGKMNISNSFQELKIIIDFTNFDVTNYREAIIIAYRLEDVGSWSKVHIHG